MLLGLLMRTIVLLFAVAAAFFVGWTFFSVPAEPPRDQVLIVGLESGYPPFEFRTPEGEIVGFDVELGALIAARLGKELIVKDMEFESELLALKQNKIDLIISGMNITPSRQKEIAMIPYYGSSANTFSLLFWKKIPPGVRGVDDIASLPGAVVSVESGSIPEAYMQANYPEILTQSFQGSLAPIMDVKFGKSLANFVQTDVANYLKKKHPEVRALAIPLKEGEVIDGFGIGVRKGNDSLYLQVKAIIEELKQSGELQRLADKWFQSDSSSSDIPPGGDGEQDRVA